MKSKLWIQILSRFAGWLLMLAGVAGVTLLLMIFAGVFHTKVDAAGDPRRRDIPPGAQFVAVQEITQPRFESAIGTIRPVHEANVASKILARVLEVNVVAGKTVRAGEVLVRLSDEEQQSRVRQAEADRDSRSAEYKLAKTELDRAAQLVRSQAISQAEYDAARTKLQTTEAYLNRASRAVEEAKSSWITRPLSRRFQVRSSINRCKPATRSVQVKHCSASMIPIKCNWWLTYANR